MIPGPHPDAAALGGELDGVRQEIDQDLTQHAFVGIDRRQGLRGLPLQVDARLARLAAHQGDAGVDDIADLEAVLVQRQLADLDLRQVEDVVDQLQQVASGDLDVLGVVTVVRLADRPQGLVLNDLREADDRVERVAQLVAHVGQELGFRPVGDLGLVLRRHQRFLGDPALTDVAQDQDQGLPVRLGDPADLHLGLEFLAVPVNGGEGLGRFGRLAQLGPEQLVEHLLAAFWRHRRQEHGEGLLQDIVGAIAEERLGPFVEQADLEGLVQADHRRRHVDHQVPETHDAAPGGSLRRRARPPGVADRAERLRLVGQRLSR